jgi:hypothetical protein
MQLYIKFGSLSKFQDLFDDNEYLRKVLRPTNYNVYNIETNNLTEIIRLLESNGINYKIKD